MMRMGGVRTEPNEIHDLKDAECVDDEECDKPPLLIAACSMPECIALDGDSPECDDEK